LFLIFIFHMQMVPAVERLDGGPERLHRCGGYFRAEWMRCSRMGLLGRSLCTFFLFFEGPV